MSDYETISFPRNTVPYIGVVDVQAQQVLFSIGFSETLTEVFRDLSHIFQGTYVMII